MDTTTLLLIATLVIAFGTVVLVYFAWRTSRDRPRSVTNLSGMDPSSLGSISRTEESRKPPSRSDPLYDGEIEVTSGEHEAIPLQLAEGDVVKGVVKARGGYEFNAYLMDEANYGKYLDGRRSRKIWTDEGVTASTIDAPVPQSGLWYLVLDLYGKQLDRTITIRLRRVPAAE